MLNQGLLRDVQDAREREAKLRASLAAVRETVELQTAGLTLALRDATAAREAAEENLRHVALAEYARTGRKAVTAGVAVKVMKDVEYDEGAALRWAKEHDVALMLDRKAFEKIAPAVPGAPVTIIERPVATIARDLAPLLGEEG